MISCVCATGSTEINSALRAELLWRMVNSMHRYPGHEFELILVDNCHGPGPHRDAINQIFDTYRTVTHLVRNRVNEYHGGGVNQGVALADGELLVQIVDDLEWEPGWLKKLVAPLIPIEASTRKRICAPLNGHNSRGKHLRTEMIGGSLYHARSIAAAYAWAFWRETYDDLGPWRRAHFADTRWANSARGKGYEFLVPVERIARETNLNYLRPWDYQAEKKNNARTTKLKYVEDAFSAGNLTMGLVVIPPTGQPLRNPVGIGPDVGYPADWLKEQAAMFMVDDR